MSDTTAPLPGSVPLCPVRVGAFEGPLDLLAHLIRTEAIPVTEVPLVEVARQYDRYLDLMRELDLEAAGECLVLIAALVYLKSKRLLPPDPSEAAGVLDDAPAPAGPVRGREVLRAAEALQEREAIMELVFPRPVSAVAEYAGEQGIDADLFALLKAFQEILRRVGTDTSARITRERITLVERMNWLLETLQRERRIGFRALFDGLSDRLSCILTFLALLEMIRLRLARAFPSHHQEDVLIVLAEESPRPPAEVSPLHA